MESLQNTPTLAGNSFRDIFEIKLTDYEQKNQG